MKAMTETSGGWASPSGQPSAVPSAVPSPVPSPVPSQSPDVTTAPPSVGAPTWAPMPGWGQPRPAEAKPGVVPLRPLGLGELLDGAVGLVRRYPRPVLGLSAGLSIVATTLNVVLAVTVFKPLIAFDISTLTGDGGASTAQLDGFVGGAALGSLGSSLVSALAAVVLSGILTVVAGRGVLGQSMTLGQAWAEVRPALLRLIAIALLTALAVYGSLALGIAAAVALFAALGGVSALLGVPLALGGVGLAVYLYCRLALAPCAAVLERAGVRGSLRRSGVLVRRSWLRVFGVLLMALVVASVVGQVVQGPFLLFGLAPTLFGGSGLGEGTTRLLVLSYLGAGIAQTLVGPFAAGVRALLYVDRRMRAEGLDVALTAAAAQRAA